MFEKAPDNQAGKEMTLSDFRQKFLLEQHNYQKMNGGCKLSTDVDATLKTLQESVLPKQENLALMVRDSVEKNDAKGRKLEAVWAEQIAKGANFVGVLDGEFHFFKNEEMLPDDNIALRIPVMDSLMAMREQNIVDARSAALQEVMGSGKKFPWMKTDAGANAAAPVESPVEETGASGTKGSFDVI